MVRSVFRIAIIISALLGGHHHVVITSPSGAGLMYTGEFCRPGLGYGRIRCIHNQLAVKAHFERTTAHRGRGSFRVRRAKVYNAAGKLSGWVDWRRPFGEVAGTPGQHLIIGKVERRLGPEEIWLN
jgi:hypothetical protein